MIRYLSCRQAISITRSTATMDANTLVQFTLPLSADNDAVVESNEDDDAADADAAASNVGEEDAGESESREGLAAESAPIE